MSVNETAPTAAPDAVGVNVTLIVQFVPAGIEAPQLLVWENAPLAMMLVKFSRDDPVFVAVIVKAVLVEPTASFPNDRDAGDRVMAAVEAVPVPVSGSNCGLDGALSTKVTAPVVAPPAVGVNVTFTVQLVDAGMEVPQLFVSEKAPLAAMLEIVSGEVPVFVTVTGDAGLVVPTA